MSHIINKLNITLIHIFKISLTPLNFYECIKIRREHDNRASAKFILDTLERKNLFVLNHKRTEVVWGNNGQGCLTWVVGTECHRPYIREMCTFNLHNLIH